MPYLKTCVKYVVSQARKTANISVTMMEKYQGRETQPTEFQLIITVICQREIVT